MVSVHRYCIEDFNRLMYEGFDYVLDANVKNTIQTLSDQVGSPEYIRTPQFHKNGRQYDQVSGKETSHHHRNSNYNNVSSTGDWNSLRQFKSTKIVKRDGVDGAIDTIRKHLNKISVKNYDKQRLDIFQELRKLIVIHHTEEGKDAGSDAGSDDENIKHEFNKVGGAIFSIASGNQFYSEIYARLYKELMEEFPSMKIIFDNNLTLFRGIFETIEFCSSDDDYDKFCANNKDNEKRRATAMFYVNLMKLGVVSRDEITCIIRDIQNYQMSKIIETDNKHIVDELSEVIYILVTNSAPVFNCDNSTDEWSSIVERVRNLAAMKVADNPSITSKTIFKNMDTSDEIKRHQK